MKQDFQLSMNRVRVNADQMKVHAVKSENGIMMNVSVGFTLGDKSSCKNDHMWNPCMCDYECNKTCKID